MGKASSAKKIRRVQQAGVSRAPGQRRNLGYPALIIAILVVGAVLTWFARESRQADASVAPVANRDHWHAAFGIDVCGVFEGNISDQGADRLGIHTHADGLVHIHPFGDGGAGENATFGKFADQVGITLGDGEFTMPDGTTYRNGDDCPSKEGGDGESGKGRVVLYVWPPQANENTEPRTVTSNLSEVRFTEDGQILVLGFVPEGYEPELPPSVPALANPIDEEPEPGGSGGGSGGEGGGSTSTPTTAPEGTAPESTQAPTSEPEG